jgi:phage baseplate assembly protein W
MTTEFKGYSTIDNKKLSLSGYELVKRDFLNAINILPGEIPGRPAYGSLITQMVFEQMTGETVELIEQELIRIANDDPRLRIDNIAVYIADHSILVELDMQVIGASPERLAIQFDENMRSATYM